MEIVLKILYCLLSHTFNDLQRIRLENIIPTKRLFILVYPKNEFYGIISVPRVSALCERDGNI